MNRLTLLIVGGEADPNTQRVVDQAHLRGIDYLFWNSSDPSSRQIAWDFSSPAIDLGEQRIEPQAVFLRYNVFDGDGFQDRYCFETIQSYTLAWPEIRVLNRTTLTDGNNKCKNLRVALKCGFEIPKTTVLGELSPLSSLPDAANHAIKPLQGGAHTLSADAWSQRGVDLDQIEPHFVQEKLTGENLRIFVIDGQPTCFHLATRMLDYREDNMVDVKQIDVPAELLKPVQQLVSEIGFDYCALDFRCRNGFQSPVFLEVNSFPMFVRFDDAGENCLVDQMLDFLTKKSSGDLN